MHQEAPKAYVIVIVYAVVVVAAVVAVAGVADVVVGNVCRKKTSTAVQN